jgi:hypothetical protein
MNQFQRLFKLIQRRVYDFLTTKYGLFLLCICVFFIFVFALQLSDTILEYRMSQFKRFANVSNLENASFILTINYNNKKTTSNSNYYYNNAQEFEEFEQYKSNIDVVYTWVNGSDPRHLENLKKYKSKNDNLTLQYVKVELDEYHNSINANVSTLRPCFYKFCMQTNNLIIAIPQLEQKDKLLFLKNAQKLFSKDVYSSISIDKIESSNRSNNEDLSVIYINHDQFKTSITTLNNLTDILKRINSMNKVTRRSSNRNIFYKFYMGYYTINCDLAPNCIENVDHTFIIKKVDSKTNGKYFR